MKLILFLNFSIALILRAYPQTSIQPYAIEIVNAEYSLSTYIGTRISIWVNTTDKSFIQLEPETDLDLIETSGGRSMKEIGEEVKRAWQLETERLAAKGRFRSSSRMEATSTIGNAKPARDTTGFVFDINILAPPPKGTKELQLTGTVAYLSAGKDTTIVSVDIPNLYDHFYNYESIEVDGKTLKLRRTGTRAYGTDYEYEATFNDKPVAGLSLDKDQFRPTIFLKDEDAKKSLKIYIQLTNSELKTVDVDMIFGLGL